MPAGQRWFDLWGSTPSIKQVVRWLSAKVREHARRVASLARRCVELEHRCEELERRCEELERRRLFASAAHFKCSQEMERRMALVVSMFVEQSASHRRTFQLISGRIDASLGRFVDEPPPIFTNAFHI